MKVTTENVASVIAKALNCRDVGSESALGNPAKWDSLHHVQIILGIESTFQVKVAPTDIAKLTSVKTIVEYLTGNEQK